MAYRFSEDIREAYPELMDRTFTEEETREVYEGIIDKSEYADFEDWMTDMLKTGLITKEAA